MKYKELTDAQKRKMNDGCSYELSKIASEILLALIILFCLPYFGNVASQILLILGAFVVAGLVLRNTVFKATPLEDLKKELKEQNNDLS